MKVTFAKLKKGYNETFITTVISFILKPIIGTMDSNATDHHNNE